MGKDNATSDFKHRKQKVGKKKLAPLNETRIDVKFARLESIRSKNTIVSEDEENEESSEKDTSSSSDHQHRRKKISINTLKETLKHTQNHNTTMRKDALITLGNILKNDPSLLSIHSSYIFQIVAERILDTESIIRTQIITLLNWILRNFPPNIDATLPHLPIIVLYLSNALSKLATDIRLDGLGILNTLVATIFSSSSTFSSNILSIFRSQLLIPTAELLEPQLYSMVVSSLLGSSLPVIYGIGQTSLSSSSTSTISSSTGVIRKRLTSIEARICCTYVLRRMLLNGNDHAVGDYLLSSSSISITNKNLLQLDSDYTPSSVPSLLNSDPSSSVPSANYVNPLLHGYFTRSLPNNRNVNRLVSSLLDTNLSTVASSISHYQHHLPPSVAFQTIAYLFQLWLECGPSEVHALAVSGIARLSLIIHTLRLIIQSIRTLSTDTIHGLHSLLVFSPRIVLHEIPDAAILKSLIEIGKNTHTNTENNISTTLNGPFTSIVSIGYRLVIRAILLYILPSFPFVSSRITSVSSSTTAVSEADIAIGILNIRIIELLCTIFPDEEGLRSARYQIQASEPYLPASSKHTNDHDNASTNGTQNPFSLLTPTVAKTNVSTVPSQAKGSNVPKNKRDRNETDASTKVVIDNQTKGHHGQKNKMSRTVETTVTDSTITEETVTEPTLVPLMNNEHYQAWRKYLAETQNIQRALKTYQTMYQKLYFYTREQLQQIKDNTNRNTDIHTSNHVAITLLPCILPLLLPLLGQIQHNLTDIQELLQLFDIVYSTSPAKSVMKARCVNFISTLFHRHTHDTVFVLPSSFIHTWIQSFPRLLWSLNTTDIETTRECFGCLHQFSLQTVNMSPLHIVLKDVLRQLTPLFYAVRTNNDANTTTGSFGPFLNYPEAIQELCLDCIANIGTLSPPLRRGLLVLCRHPGISRNIRTKIVEVMVFATLSMDTLLPNTIRVSNELPENNVSSGLFTVNEALNSVPEACAEVLAMLLSLVLGRSIDRSVYVSGPLLTIQPLNKGDRGDIADTLTVINEFAQETDILGIENLCQGDSNVYQQVIDTYGQYLRMLLGLYWKHRITIIRTVHYVLDFCLTERLKERSTKTTTSTMEPDRSNTTYRSLSLLHLSRSWNTVTNSLLRTTYEVCPPSPATFEEKLLAAVYLQAYERQFGKDNTGSTVSVFVGMMMNNENLTFIDLWWKDNAEYFENLHTSTEAVSSIETTTISRNEIQERLSLLLSMLTILIQNYTGKKDLSVLHLRTLITTLEELQTRVLLQSNNKPERTSSLWTTTLLDKLFSVIQMGKRTLSE